MTSLISTIAEKTLATVVPTPFQDIGSVVSSTAFPDLTFSYCQPLKDESAFDAQNWQNPIVVEMLQTLDPGGLIGIAPFFRLTAGHHDLHPSGGRDCTHFCSAPLLWAPVWDYLALRWVQFASHHR